MPFIEELYEKYLLEMSVSVNVHKKIQKGLFFAIRRKDFNGNPLAIKALENGASYAIIDEPKYYFPGKNYILVKDSLAILKQLAHHHRLQYTIPVIAITGSYGKSTTKELTYRVLSTKYNVVATVGNLNTDVGAALVILSIKKDTQIVVIEMGASELNEIASYCQMVEPTHGLITAIGEAHLDTFGNLDRVYKAKSELYDYLYSNSGTVFLNTMEPSLSLLSKRFIHPITYPQCSDFCSSYFVDASPYMRYRDEEGTEILTHLFGKFYFHNVSAALCMAKYFNVPIVDANEAIKSYIPSNRRMQVVSKGSNLLVVDTCHANPIPVQAALEAILRVEVKFRVVILADMAGLGSDARIWHRKILKLLESENYHLVLLCGPLFLLNADQVVNSKFRFFSTKDLLVDYLNLQHFEHSVILFKGANHWEMHTLVENIMEPM